MAMLTEKPSSEMGMARKRLASSGVMSSRQVHDGQQGCGSRHLRDDVFCKIIGLDQEIDQVLGGRFLTARVLKNLFIQIAGLRKKFDEI